MRTVVVPVGRRRVLKLGSRHSEALHEALGLRFWDGDGAIRVHRSGEFGEVSALLLERCRPGTPLGRALAEFDQDVVVAELLRRLWWPAGPPFRPLRDMCDACSTVSGW